MALHTMRPKTPHVLTAWIAILIQVHACGPFFPDTVLDQPQAALDVPPVSYLHDLYEISGMAAPADAVDDDSGDRGFLRQIPLESSELRAVWEQEGVADDVIERRIEHYETVRHELLAPIAEAGAMDFPTHGDEPLTLPVRPLGEDFPVDVADYVEAARLHAAGNTEEARKLWKSILDRPPAERRLRAAWAAWMLAKTSPDLNACMNWYARVEREIKAGATDAIGLRGAAKAWRAGQMADGPVKAIHFFHEAFVGGKTSSAIDLRRLSWKILDSDDANLMTEAAADPLVRRLINLELHASLDGPRQDFIDPEMAGEQAPVPPAAWLAALESSEAMPMDDGARVAWTLYASGRFNEARKWLGLSVKTDSLAIWLQAKFDLRDGNLDAANQHLTEAIAAQSKKSDWKPENPELFQSWHSTASERQHANQGRLMADAGVVALARRDYLTALDLRNSGYEEDAAYLAEEVISTDGLITLRKVAPEWTAEPSPEGPVDPLNCLKKAYANVAPNGIGPGGALRYLLARRLAREHRLKEAREFMPPDLLPLLDHYIALDRARKSGKYSGVANAAVVWRQALDSPALRSGVVFHRWCAGRRDPRVEL